MFAKILVPFDGSAHSIWSLQNAMEIGKIYKSEIIVLHSVRHYLRSVNANAYFPIFGMSNVTPLNQEKYGISASEEAAIFQSQKNIGVRLLEEAKKKVDASGLKCETVLAENMEPVEAVKDLVEKRGIDLVIVGARGVHNVVERVFLGSVSSGIVNSVCTNIMIMRSECAESHGMVPSEQPKKQKAKGKA